jgi:hypothetical protein
VSVIHADSCVGFLLRRFDGFQAFDRDEHSLGVFIDERDAVAAIFTHKPIESAA